MSLVIISSKMEAKIEKEKEKSSVSFRQLLSAYKGDCSVHGVGHVGRGSFFRGLIWFAAVCTSTSYLLYLLYEEWTAYYQYPFMTSTSVQKVSTMKFPAITFCNLSPYNKSVVVSDPRDEEFYMAISKLGIFVDDINWTDPYYRDNGYFTPRTRDDVATEALNRRAVIKSITFDMGDVGQDIEETVTRYGMCYTWNSNGSATTSSTGNNFNFYALLSVNSDQSYQSIDCSTGFKVTVHDPNEDPAIENNGFLVPPGKFALAKLKKTRYSYLGDPFKAFGDASCVDTLSSDFNNPFHPKLYDTSACRRKCNTDQTFQRCGCMAMGSNGNYPICSHYQYYQCYYNTSRPSENSLSPCDCPQPCRQTTYDIQVSYATFPTEETAEFLKGRFNVTKDYIRQNFVELHIYFDNLQVHRVKQEPVYASTKDILSNIGGQMGLLLGASLLSLLEISEFLVNCAIHLMFKCYDWYNGKRRNKIKQNSEKTGLQN